jgi:hypothetical protein
MDRIWTYHKNRYHENTSQQVVHYKTEALDRRYEEIWVKHAGLVEMLHNFQTKHSENRKSIGNLNYESKHYWMNLADQYITGVDHQADQRCILYPNSWGQDLE